ncbi:MAG: FAD-dependent tricarballylate dehydrogenase TcuA [Pseudomonadota bacterium]
MNRQVIVVGSGNAALCAGLAALEGGADVTLLEKASADEAGGNTRYTAGAMRFVYNSGEELMPLLLNREDERLPWTDFGDYTAEQFSSDLLNFNDGQPLTRQQEILIDRSYDTLAWLASHNVRFEPIYSRQSFQKKGRFVFWGGLTLAAQGEGDGLYQAEVKAFEAAGGRIEFDCAVTDLIMDGGRVAGVRVKADDGLQDRPADAVILACGGFEANPEKRAALMGGKWRDAKVRGTRHNTGDGFDMALAAGGVLCGRPDGCHAVPMDRAMPNYGNLDIEFSERKHYRKICYFLGVMLNAEGKRFVDEGENFRNYTYAQFGRAILEQPGAAAWQIFDAKVESLLYSEYRFWDAKFLKADTIEDLLASIEGIDRDAALKTVAEFNAAVDREREFDPTILDGKGTRGLSPDKTNWACALDTPPFLAYPVTCGITFTYSGLRVDDEARVLREDGAPIDGLLACGEMVGNVFIAGYPGGSGLTSGAVFGRQAGSTAAQAQVMPNEA